MIRAYKDCRMLSINKNPLLKGKTAMSYGCKQVDEFFDEINEITKVFAISKDEWINR